MPALPQGFSARITKPFVFNMCLVENCCETVKAKKLCSKHLQRQFRNKSVAARTRFEPNQIEIKTDLALISLYDRKGLVVAKAKIDVEDVDKIKNIVWTHLPTNVKNLAYCFNAKFGKMHHFIMNTKCKLDHINHDGLDNRKSNLRFCTSQENNQNKNIPKNNTSGAKGVSWNKRTMKFVAYITINRKIKHLGRFSNLINAAEAYNEAAKELFGEFAQLNNIEALRLQNAVK